MRHTYRCPVRWGDMDMLGHVNNVLYVDYLQEARIDMMRLHARFRGGEELAEGVVVVRHEIEFVVPLTYREAPVLIDVWVTEVRAASFTMAYEIYDETDNGRIVYLRASSVMAPYVFGEDRPRRLATDERAVLTQYLEAAAPRRELIRNGHGRDVFPVTVRWSDMDAYRHVNNVKYFEYFQEARIHYLLALRPPDDTWGSWVVARTDMDYRRPVFFRPEPYQMHSWVSDVGSSSFTIGCELRDGDETLASGAVVMVAFDPTAQRAAPMADTIKELLRDEAQAALAP